MTGMAWMTEENRTFVVGEWLTYDVMDAFGQMAKETGTLPSVSSSVLSFPMMMEKAYHLYSIYTIYSLQKFITDTDNKGNVTFERVDAVSSSEQHNHPWKVKCESDANR